MSHTQRQSFVIEIKICFCLFTLGQFNAIPSLRIYLGALLRKVSAKISIAPALNEIVI